MKCLNNVKLNVNLNFNNVSYYLINKRNKLIILFN